MPPFSVNLTPLPNRLSSTCFRRGASPMTPSGTSSPNCSVMLRLRLSALARNKAVAEATTACSDIGAQVSVSLPASILEWSSTSFRMSISDSPEAAAVLTRRRWRMSSVVWRSRSRAPSTPFMGVRISWLIVARNWLLATLAASAASLARSSELLAASASRLWRRLRTAVSPNSRVARTIVSPNKSASTASGSDCAAPGVSDTMASEPSCRPASSRKLRPAIDRKKAAVATEPQTMTR